MEDVTSMSKITILFGAGAEGKGQFNLPSGEGFKRDVVLANNVASFANLFLQKAESGITLSNGTIISHNSSSILYQTIVERQEIDADILEILFPNQDDRDIAKSYLRNKQDKNADASETINRAFAGLYKNNFYDAIKSQKGDIESKAISYFLKHAGIYSFLDSLFNYLRKPDSYKKECARVIKVYYAALLSILNGMSNSLDKNEDERLLNMYSELIAGKKTSDVPEKLLAEVIEGFQTAIINKSLSLTDAERNKLYYYNVRKLSEYNDSCISCVTTNYTNIGQQIINLPDDRFSYLHGKLGLFEELETKRISTITQIDLKKTVFPYLLVQSGVKPIISPSQIREFYKACSMINDADYMLIIGYGINLDDEHVTTILKERLMKGRKIKYFVYCHSKESKEWDEKINAVKDQLGYDDLLEFYHTDEFKDTIFSLK